MNDDFLLELAAKAGEKEFTGETLEKFRLFLTMKVIMDPDAFRLMCKLLEYDVPVDTVYQILRRLFLEESRSSDDWNTDSENVVDNSSS